VTRRRNARRERPTRSVLALPVAKAKLTATYLENNVAKDMKQGARHVSGVIWPLWRIIYNILPSAKSTEPK
jgi:hypothetical protein